MKNAYLIVLMIAVAACSDIGVELESEYGESLALQESFDMAAKKGDKVRVCHFPPSDPENVQILSVSANAAESHVSNHAGDGVIGVMYGENCQPMTCPCFDRADIDVHLPNEPIYQSGPFYQDNPPHYNIFAHLPWDGSGRHRSISLTSAFDWQNVPYCILVDHRLDEVLVRKPIALGEKLECEALLRDKTAAEGYPRW